MHHGWSLTDTEVSCMTALYRSQTDSRRQHEPLEQREIQCRQNNQ